ncbi:cuticle protein 18.6-like [Lepeophtheirus salmonis]|uniref:cuticle protein 18.6-like n=1 Tax=Lepeophtheirus salmonis TaxID=72036 RepID=UPI001AE4827F|nr:cuticle protein 19.8-like [Lepeophtheirus salmonis]
MVSKAIALFFVLASALADTQYQPPTYTYPDTFQQPSSTSPLRTDPYSYQYAVQDGPSGNDFSAQESSDGQVVSGSYRVLLPDGRVKVVTYEVEGGSGFVADVKYEGTPYYAVGPQDKYV